MWARIREGRFAIDIELDETVGVEAPRSILLTLRHRGALLLGVHPGNFAFEIATPRSSRSMHSASIWQAVAIGSRAGGDFLFPERHQQLSFGSRPGLGT